jgi:hypothetical protein
MNQKAQDEITTVNLTNEEFAHLLRDSKFVVGTHFNYYLMPDDIAAKFDAEPLPPNVESSATGDPKPSPANAELQAPTPVGCSDLLGVRFVRHPSIDASHDYGVKMKPYQDKNLP